MMFCEKGRLILLFLDNTKYNMLLNRDVYLALRTASRAGFSVS